MSTATHSAPASPRRRAAPAVSPAASAKPHQAKKLTKKSVETTAEAFLTLFKTLPGAVKGRIVQMIEDYEDELDEKQLAAERMANPEDFDPKNGVTLEEYMNERQARSSKNAESKSLAA